MRFFTTIEPLLETDQHDETQADAASEPKPRPISINL
jgi:hypothetical protein